MKRVFIQTIHLVINLFNRIIDKEAQRVFEFNSQILRAQAKGGERLKS